MKEECFIDIPIQYQYPILPTGCEVTSLSMLLQSIEINNNDNNDQPSSSPFTKESLAKIVFKESDPHMVNQQLIGGNPYRSFIGEPTSKESFGMFHQPLAQLLDKMLVDYLDRINGQYKVVDLTNNTHKHHLQDNESKSTIESRLNYFEETNDQDDSDVDVLEEFLSNQQHAIVIWMTLELRQPRVTDTWQDEKIITNQIHWVSPEHCALLVGYTSKHYIINDPHTGKVEHYDKELFKKRWRQLGRQAISIINK
ncbi:hypothetical protein DFA_09148 [Cavenderia fasciculata]|uniref:Peptidase C39-like domain-containing protein n=1 Tax=Cavenderia fasciculata TaxID=261658 RepID=F4Q6U1_CACFS|nr:uncharacterized protein DFA_09148 [Cavenderia fasciculata]EGG16601.1 hypothetical protein DFA_09148 [Cavenderia fasciculata]|eukprot:XP_004355001.1 hypothetical protein DFA_09148 [Cavenderia fasciculata]